MISNRPASSKWVTIEEHRSLEEQSGSLVQAEGFPETGVDGFYSCVSITWAVTVIRSYIQSGTRTTDITLLWGNPGLLTQIATRHRIFHMKHANVFRDSLGMEPPERCPEES
jgi:hypothetical protein